MVTVFAVHSEEGSEITGSVCLFVCDGIDSL